MVVLGSHNSWSYLPPKRWWMRPFAFMAKCQKADIKTQYLKYGVRCFDLRILFDEDRSSLVDLGRPIVAHGLIKYKIPDWQLYSDLKWLDERGYCFVRVVNEVRRKSQYTLDNRYYFREFCQTIERRYKNLSFFGGINLYNKNLDFEFKLSNIWPTYNESHVSVSKYKYLLGWWPWLYAKINNRRIRSKGTSRQILMIDFVNL